MDVEREPSDAPWEELETLLEKTPDAEQVGAYLDSLPAGEASRAVSRLSEEDQIQLLTTLAPHEAAALIQQVPESHVVEWLSQVAPQQAADIIEELPSDLQADLLGAVDQQDAEAILSRMEPETAQEARSLSQYDDEVAGGLMVTEYLAYPRDYLVSQVIDDMRANADEYRDYHVQYAYVIDDQEHLVGVLRLRDLLLARPRQAIQQLMLPQPLSVLDSAPLDQLRDFFDRHKFFGVPVTDAEGVLLGVVQFSAVEEALGDRQADDYRKAQGIIQEELRTMPLIVRSRRRLAWLSVNILLNVVAASVIAFYQETLSQVIALAVFLPIISDMSGCSGNQAVAVSMRELALGLVRPHEVLHVWYKEIGVGLLNGLALGLLIALVAWLWKGNGWLGLVVGTAMALNTMLAVSIGGTLPLIMRRLGMDPALASGPILTTITDMCGFFLILSLAAAMLPWIT